MATENQTENQDQELDQPVSKADQYKKWGMEIDGAEKRLKDWHKQADKIVSRYLSEKKDNSTDKYGGDTRINLFYSNTSTLESMLYGKAPQVDVARRFADSKDDISRIAAETMGRLLNSELAVNGKEFDSVMQSALQDRLLSGLGCAKLRYELETATKTIPEQVVENGQVVVVNTEREVLVDETVPIDYYYWGDVLWGWARNFAEVPWIAFRNYLTKEEATKRFGEEKAKELTYNVRTVMQEPNADENDNKSEERQAEVWEIWDKRERKVCWYAKNCTYLLDSDEDKLKLRGFYPCPPFMIANPTTRLYKPTPDFLESQDLYNEIDILQTRISILTQAVKAVGVYDKAADGIQRVMSETVDNQLIPVDSWAAFAEKGGIRGSVDWVPIDAITAAINKLVELRDSTISILQQVSGMADVMRGSLNNQYEGVGQTKDKVKFGSVRVQRLQENLAAFATDIMQLKAEIISKHFSPETIIKKSNMMYSYDAQELNKAVQLIKDFNQARLSVVIRPESVAMIDYTELQAERTGFLNAVSHFMQTINPIIEQQPTAQPYLLEILKWGLSGFKGAQEIEGVMDKAIEASLEAAKNAPDPAQQQQQMMQQQMQMEMQKEMQKFKLEIQAEQQKAQIKVQSENAIREADKVADITTIQVQSEADVRKIQADSAADIGEIQAKTESELIKQQSDADNNIRQSVSANMAELEKTAAQTQIEIQKAATEAEIELEKEAQKGVQNDTE